MRGGGLSLRKDKPVNTEFPIALRKAKIVCNFGLSECYRVKVYGSIFSKDPSSLEVMCMPS